MKTITSKAAMDQLLDPCLAAYRNQGVEACAQAVYTHVLEAKIKFPILEHAALSIFQNLAPSDHIPFCDRIEALKTIGGNVLLGIILQQRLGEYFDETVDKAAKYISKADVWYVCDIIGERVWGVSLLNAPEKTLPVIRTLSKHPSRWVVRSLGAGGHYAIKKGLPQIYADALFELLLSMANTTDKEIRQGVGWAAKTTAKFHPDIIQKYQQRINDTQQVAAWFRSKVAIGLNRNLYKKWRGK